VACEPLRGLKKGKMKYKVEKLETPIWRSGRRIFKYKILRLSDKETVFLFQDKKTAEDTLGRLK